MARREACCIPIVIILGGLLYDDALNRQSFIAMARVFRQLDLILKPKVTAAEAIALMIALADMIERTQKDVPVLIYYYGHADGISINVSREMAIEIEDLFCPLGASEHMKEINKMILLECCRVGDDGVIRKCPSIDDYHNHLGSSLLAYSTLHGKAAEGPIWGISLAKHFEQSLPVINIVLEANLDVREKTEQMPILHATTSGWMNLRAYAGWLIHMLVCNEVGYNIVLSLKYRSEIVCPQFGLLKYRPHLARLHGGISTSSCIPKLLT